MRLFGTLNNVPSDDDELLIYTDGEGKEVEPALSLSQSFVDGGKHSIKRVEDGKEIKVFIGDVNVIPGESSPVPPTPPTPTYDPFVLFSGESPFTMSLEAYEEGNPYIEYSMDSETWYPIGLSVEIMSGEGSKIYLRGLGNKWVNNNVLGITITGENISVSGNVEALLDYQVVLAGGHPEMGEYCYTGLFSYNESIISVAQLQLPAPTLVEYCYHQMFCDCTSLTTAPASISATILADYCCQEMFSGCTSLITTPALPATTLADYCYHQMFYNCTALTTAPELPATILANECYGSMFNICTALTTAPELPATALADYCYEGMFSECTALTTTPKLSATTLVDGCYSSMFYSCTSLTAISELPATTLAYSCYDGMFYGCTSIKLSATQDSDYTIPYRMPKEGVGTDASRALINMFTDTGGTFTGTPTINTTYYLHKDNHIV